MMTQDEIEREAQDMVKRMDNTKEVKVPKDLGERLEAMAAEQGVTVGELAVKIIEAELDRADVKLTEDELKVAQRVEEIIKARRAASGEA